MKKIFILVCASLTSGFSFAQFPNAGFETWRSNAAGSSSITVHAPTYWYGFDSLIVAALTNPFIAGYLSPTGAENAQLFQETNPAYVHSGSSSAKVMTLLQDSLLGFIPGSLSNAVATVNFASLLTGGSITPATVAAATTFSGGTAVSQRITTVSAWVQYYPGIDSVGVHSADTGLLTVQVRGHRSGGLDTNVGTGVVPIPPTSSWTQVTANVLYFDTVNYDIDTIRVVFSSGGAGQALDSSTLYVDDVSMAGVANPNLTAVPNVVAANALNVYPNPAKNVLYVDAVQPGATEFTLYSITGAAVANKIISGHDVIDVSSLAAGIYIYIARDAGGSVLQRGEVTLNR